MTDEERASDLAKILKKLWDEDATFSDVDAAILSALQAVREEMRCQATVEQAEAHHRADGVLQSGAESVAFDGEEEEYEDLHAAIADMTFDGFTPDEVAEMARRSAKRSIDELNAALLEVRQNPVRPD